MWLAGNRRRCGTKSKVYHNRLYVLTPDQGGLPSRYRDAGILAELEEHGQKQVQRLDARAGCGFTRAHPLTFKLKASGVRSSYL